MRVRTYLTRGYATLTRSELPRTFTGSFTHSASTLRRKPTRLTFRYLSGFSPYTSSCELKQGLVFLINSRQGNVSCDPKTLAGRGSSYCELTNAFLPSSLTRFHPFTLALLRQSTCVGLRYESPTNLILKKFF